MIDIDKLIRRKVSPKLSRDKRTTILSRCSLIIFSCLMISILDKLMEQFDYQESSTSVSYLSPIEGIRFDGRSYALYGKTIKQKTNQSIFFI